MNKIAEVINHIFTGRDGESYSLTKIFGITGVASLTYNFINNASADFTGYGIAVTGVMAAMAVKYAVEEK